MRRKHWVLLTVLTIIIILLGYLAMTFLSAPDEDDVSLRNSESVVVMNDSNFNQSMDIFMNPHVGIDASTEVIPNAG